MCAKPGVALDDVAAAARDLRCDVLLELATEHGMMGLLTARLRELDFAGVPAVAREALQSRMRAQHLFALSMTAELFRITDDFAQHGIDTMLTKGPVVSELGYGDPAIRNYVDLDLLVRDAEIGRAAERMGALGFSSKVAAAAMAAGKVPGEYVFVRPGTKQLIELHTAATFRYYPRPMPLDALFARRRMVPIEGRPIPALRLEDEFVLNCIHGAKHFWERLMWVADVAGIVARHPELDWAKAREAAQDVGAERLLRLALRLAEAELGVDVPQPMRDDLRADAGVAPLCAAVRGWLPYASYAEPGLLERAKFRRGMAGGGVAGWKYLFRLLLSPTEEDWEAGVEGKRSWLWDALRRPMRLVRKYGAPGDR